MTNDEHEMLVEYSEMTAFDFNSKEYQEVKQDYLECKKAVTGFDWLVKTDVITKDDLGFFEYAETVDEAFNFITAKLEKQMSLKKM